MLQATFAALIFLLMFTLHFCGLHLSHTHSLDHDFYDSFIFIFG
jgi:hypothetical protein